MCGQAQDIHIDQPRRRKLTALVARRRSPATPQSVVAELIDAAFETMADELTAAAEDATRWQEGEDDHA